ncbi:MAG: isocitrate lyase/phosphoenolpyruvate mutase family protein [Pseudomonadales bacterium]|nr:isocitrate lyase/phosphoenolpyruvate mutase family protein [Pseudomonadales bacterium]
MPDQASKCAVFADLHQQTDTWLIPNPWDVGSARVLQGLGYPALATTSSGFAFTLGRADGQVSLGKKLEHCRQLSAATSIPINADFENGYSDDLSQMRDNIKRVIETGVAGLSIEDYSRDQHLIYGLNESVERVHAAVETISEVGVPVLLTARAENLIRGVDDRDDTLERLQAYSKAGAEVLYAPGLVEMEHVESFVSATDKPLNVLAPFVRNATMEQFNAAGVCRISTGGALTWASLKPLLDGGKEMLESGAFSWLKQMAKGTEIQSLLQK